MTQPEPTGEAAARTIRACLLDARLNPSDVDHVNAHATATPQNDPAETLALKLALGARAKEIPVSAVKSMLGHCLCSAGAIEAAATVLTIESGTLPPTIRYDLPDPECDLDVVPNVARKHRVRAALSSMAPDFANSAPLAGAGLREPSAERHGADSHGWVRHWPNILASSNRRGRHLRKLTSDSKRR